MAEAPGGLIGSPSVSGTEQMSEWKDRSPFASKFTFSSLCVCVCVSAAANVCTGVSSLFCVALTVCVCLTFHTLVDTGPTGADCLPYGVS